MNKSLRIDGWVRIAAIFLAVILGLALAFPDSPQKTVWLGLAFAFFTLGCGLGILRSTDRSHAEDRLFWSMIGAASILMSLRMVVVSSMHSKPEGTFFHFFGLSHGPSQDWLLILDGMTLAIYGLYLVGAGARPDIHAHLTGRRGSRRLDTTGAVVFTASLFFYFCLIPDVFAPPLFASRSPSLVLYSFIVAHLTLRSAFLWRATHNRSWRQIYLISAIAHCLPLSASVMHLSLMTPTLPPLWEALFALSISSLLFLASARTWGKPEQRSSEHLNLDEPPEAVAARLLGRLALYALLLPVAHFIAHLVGASSILALQVQQVLIIVHLMLFGLLMALQYRVLESTSLQVLRARRESDRQRLMLEKGIAATDLGISIKDLDGRLLYVNPAQARMAQSTPEALVGKKSSIFGIEELSRPMKPQEVEQLERWSRESVNIRQDGSRFPVQLTSDLVRDDSGRPLSIVTACEDITERRRIQEALLQSERDYRGLYENAHDAIFIFRPEDEVILEANPAAAKLYAIPREELVGMSLESVSHDLEQGKQHLHEVLWKGDFHEFETKQYRSDGTLMNLEVRAAIVEYGGGLAILSINRDITERKRAEQALRQTNEELKSFLALISHDLRAPMVNLRGFAQELRLSLEQVEALVHPSPPLDEPSPPREGQNADSQSSRPAAESRARQRALEALRSHVPEALEHIESAVGRLDALIQALLKLARAGRRQLEPETLDLDALVREVLASLSFEINSADAEVTVDELPPLIADRFSMEQVLANLLHNAINYLDPQRPGRIHVGGTALGQEVQLWVRDTGRGISPEDLEKVFQPLRRCGPQEQPGEGMGLAYAQALMRRHGGRLWCDSTLGEGSTFYLQLQARPSDSGQHPLNVEIPELSDIQSEPSR